jgi:hypothetical protein
MQFLSRSIRVSGKRYLPLLTAVTLLGGAANAQDTPGIVVNGTLELNYTANFNKPVNGSNTFLYNKQEGQFAINLAQLQLSKTATPTSRTGFMLRVVDGSVRRYNYNFGEASDLDSTALPNILEAYGTLLVPFKGKDLKVDAGQFVTHVGYETIDIGTNNFVSRNFLFQFPSPFYNTGVRAALPLGSRTTVTGFILNRYNGTNDTGNRDLGYGFQVAQTLNSKSSVVLNGLTTRENLNYVGAGPDSGFTPPTDETALLSSSRNLGVSVPANRQLSVLDIVYSNQFSKPLKFVFEGLYRFGKNIDEKSYNVTGGAAYLIYTMGNGNVLGLRGEYLRQSNAEGGVLPVFGSSTEKPSLSSITASYELKGALFPGSRTLFEVRFDNAYDKIFPSDKATFDKKNQTTFTIGQVFAF